MGGEKRQYMNGFGNHFSSEALPGVFRLDKIIRRSLPLD